VLGEAVKIVINGLHVDLDNVRHIDLNGGITYEHIVQLAGETGYPTVAYSGPRKGDSRRSGEMHHGCDPVILDDGMVFSVMHTGDA
jgi:hypothetical protein